MKTSIAAKNKYICPDPECGGELTQDLKHRGFVRHKTRERKDGKLCLKGRGEKD